MIKLDITSLVVILTLYTCFQCARRHSAGEIKECLKTLPGEICIKMHKGL